MLAIGDQRNFVSALIVPEREVLEAWARERGIEGGAEELCSDERVVDHYDAIVEAKMGGFSRYERVKKLTLVPDEFSQETGELTPTLKLKRRVILAKYEEVIDAMYTGANPTAG